MNQFLSFISDIRIVIAIAVIIVLLTIWLIIQRVKGSRFRKELNELEAYYKQVKNIPVSLKMNKAVSITKSDEETVRKVNEAQASFTSIQNDLTRIANELADAEDYVSGGKLRKAETVMTSVETELKTVETSVRELETNLDEILAKETSQRQEVTRLKNRFRALKAAAAENENKLSFGWPMIDQKANDIDKMFSTFEEWMFSNDFDKANAQLDSIKLAMQELENDLDTMPSLIEDARGIIPKMAENLHNDYARARKAGVYLKHLEVQKNLSVMTVALKEDMKQLKAGNTEGVREHLDDYKTRISQMDEAVKNETYAFRDLKKISAETDEISDDANRNAKFLSDAFAKYSDKFGFGTLKEDMEENMALLAELNEAKPTVMDTTNFYQKPATEAMSSLKNLNQQYSECNEALLNIRRQIETATGDEDRARKQLVKLQIIMNQIQVKIRKYKLPNISETYEEDMFEANEYVHRLEDLMDSIPLNIQLLNSTLQEALNFIYKLYNNVNNVVGAAVMVENSIVFANRYRSTYADVDSSLTRAELTYRNGEYTQALSTAINAIEKVHPGNYEAMIKENAKSAA